MMMCRHRVWHTLRTAYTEVSIHQVQHTPRTASTVDCVFFPHSHEYELTHQNNFSFKGASLPDQPPAASSPWELKGKATLSHSQRCKITNCWIESQHTAWYPSTACKSSSNLARSRPSISPNSHAYSLQVFTILATKCTSSNSLDHRLQVLPHTC